MLNKRFAKGILCAGLVAGVIIGTESMTVLSTTMSSEKELAGMSFTLDQYCATQAKSGVSNPEAIVAFAASDKSGGMLTQDEINSIDSGIVPNDAAAASQAAITTTQTPVPTSTPQPTVKPKSEFANIGVSVAEGYVRVRAKASEKSKVVGKLYRGSAAKIVKRKGAWVQIRSGKVTGYIKKEFLAIGYSVNKLVAEFGTKYATVTGETVRVREKKTTDSKILTLIPLGEKYEVVSESKDWIKLEIDGDTGYVSRDFLKLSVKFKQAVSIEEEKAEARRKAAAEAAANQNPVSHSNNNSNSSSQSSRRKSSSSSSSSRRKSTISSSNGGNSGGSSISASGSGSGSAVANYALNFVGNPYVYGGTSLTHGTDCSGFVQSIYKKFGISLPRTSGGQAGAGRGVSMSDVRAGDIIYYGGHVAIYIGGGKVVHASNPKSGIKVSNWKYRTPRAVRRIF